MHLNIEVSREVRMSAYANFTSDLPRLSPVKSAMNAFGAFSRPSVIVSRQTIFSDLIQVVMSR